MTEETRVPAGYVKAEVSLAVLSLNVMEWLGTLFVETIYHVDARPDRSQGMPWLRVTMPEGVSPRIVLLDESDLAAAMTHALMPDGVFGMDVVVHVIAWHSTRDELVLNLDLYEKGALEQ